jgi:endoglucanase
MKEKKIIYNLMLSFLFLFPVKTSAQGFLHRQDKIIVNGSGQEILLKGIGLGGWLVQEGYMLQTSGFANAQWEIRQHISDLVGEANTEIFYEKYLNNFIRKVDIDSIKSWGFNSIRLPFHYNLFSNPPEFSDKGFQIIDSLLSWCEANQIYLILDMHAAPGGQSNQNISDYNPAYPSLWESEQNKNLTVKIWRKIAERYTDKEWIGGYDLLNETYWYPLDPNNQPLRELFIRITDTIRVVDQNHIVFIEGNGYANDFNGLEPAWDENMAYSFHKYWNTNDKGSIQYLLDMRDRTNRPLWLGETGENSNQWFVDCVELMKNNNIGWAWWTHKKIETISAPLSAYSLPVYQTLLNYWNGQGSKPSETYAMNALMAEADQLLLEHCVYRKDYIDALFRQPFNTSTIPFADNQIPGVVNATDYDLGQVDYAYKDVDYQNTGGGTYNSGYSYRNDGVDIEHCDDFSSNGYNIGWIESNEWMKYNVNIKQGGTYNIHVNVASQNTGGKIILSLDGLTLSNSITDIPATGGWQSWQYVTIPGIYLPLGNHSIQFRIIFGGFNFSYMDFELIATDVEESSQTPYSFKLDQNYPNPFNPSTTIQYLVPQRSIVTLKVYNVLGNEIAVLVNEEKGAGVYKINFDASKLASGVYFYKLQANSFIETKEMILLK